MKKGLFWAIWVLLATPALLLFLAARNTYNSESGGFLAWVMVFLILCFACLRAVLEDHGLGKIILELLGCVSGGVFGAYMVGVGMFGTAIFDVDYEVFTALAGLVAFLPGFFYPVYVGSEAVKHFDEIEEKVARAKARRAKKQNNKNKK